MVTAEPGRFMVWLSITWLFHIAKDGLEGGWVVRSLKLYGIAWLFFAALSGVYMNHYSHAKDFYLFNVLDALIVFPIVAIANGCFTRGSAWPKRGGPKPRSGRS